MNREDILGSYTRTMRRYMPSATVKVIVPFGADLWESQKPIKDISSFEALTKMTSTILDERKVGSRDSLDLIHSCSVEMLVVNFPEFQEQVLSSLSLSRERRQSLYMDVPLHPNLVLHRPLVNVDLAWHLGYYGEKTRIAVVDTGVDESHPDLQVTYSANFSDDSDSRDLVGHGTHIAVIAAGRGHSGGDGLGVAPNAGLISIKVLPGYESNI